MNPVLISALLAVLANAPEVVVLLVTIHLTVKGGVEMLRIGHQVQSDRVCWLARGAYLQATSEGNQLKITISYDRSF